ncbi:MULTISPECIES: Na+/H+ antiporter subunit E [unclassified Rickettsia]|uniref:Na+/H+ antiporter subunit E n=2 Tax=Rickettsia TaxID=780 RepID=UPI00313B7D22
MRIKIITFFILSIIWIGLMGELNNPIKMLWMGIVPVGIYLFSRWLDIIPHKMHLNYKAPLYFLWLLVEIYKSAFAVIKIVWGRDMKIEPTFEWVDAEGLPEIGQVIYGNSITLTPGTVTLDINNNMLLVHALNKSSIDDLKNGIMLNKVKGMLRR